MNINNKNLPRLIAHRGARCEAPENTIPAFKRAIELGTDGIEFDVMLTKDYVPLVTHNNDLSMLTSFNGFVDKTPFSILKSLDFGSYFNSSFSHITVPTLTEVLEFLQPHDISIICEIKKQSGMAAHSAKIISDIICDFKFKKPIVVSSFDMRVLYYLKKIAPTIPRVLIIKKDVFSFLRPRIFAKLLHVSEIHVVASILNSSMVENAHKNKNYVAAWTINSSKEIDRCIELNVDSIITDDISMARTCLGKTNNHDSSA